MFGKLLTDIGSIWTKYGSVYLDGIANTLILATVATLIGCIIGFFCGILQTIPYNSNDFIVKRFYGYMGCQYPGGIDQYRSLYGRIRPRRYHEH